MPHLHSACPCAICWNRDGHPTRRSSQREYWLLYCECFRAEATKGRIGQVLGPRSGNEPWHVRPLLQRVKELWRRAAAQAQVSSAKPTPQKEKADAGEEDREEGGCKQGRRFDEAEAKEEDRARQITSRLESAPGRLLRLLGRAG